MNILFADQFPAHYVAQIEAMGHSCTVKPSLTTAELPTAMADQDIVVVRGTEVTAEAFDGDVRVSLVIRAGAGTNTIDVAAAAARGIYVSNVPGKNAVAVAELTMALILAIDRSIADSVADLRAGRWDKKRYAKARGLAGRSLGIVGLGQIGLSVAERAAAMQLRVKGVARTNRSTEQTRRIDELGIELVADLDELAATCDILTFHLPAAAETTHIVNREFLAKLADGAWLINTSRGELIDEDALLDVIDDKQLRVGLDVYDNEPDTGRGVFDSRLAKHARVYGTHHIGASTDQAQESIAEEVTRIIAAYEQGVVMHCVNLSEALGGVNVIGVRHSNEVGVLVEILQILRTAGLNVEQMENQIFAGAAAANATIRLTGGLERETLDDVRALGRVYAVTVRGGHN